MVEHDSSAQAKLQSTNYSEAVSFMSSLLEDAVSDTEFTDMDRFLEAAADLPITTMLAGATVCLFACLFRCCWCWCWGEIE